MTIDWENLWVKDAEFANKQVIQWWKVIWKIWSVEQNQRSIDILIVLSRFVVNKKNLNLTKKITEKRNYFW